MSKKGYKQTEKHIRKRMIEANKGWFKKGRCEKHLEETKKKISEKLKGQHHSFTTEFKKGNKHWNWKESKFS